MNQAKIALISGAAGVFIALVVILLNITSINSGSSSAADPNQVRARYVAFVSPETLRLLGSPEIQDSLRLDQVDAADAVRPLVFQSDADGIIMDAETMEALPEGTMANLFASGRVIVVFNVEKQDILRASNSSDAFPDADKALIPDVTMNPGDPVGGFSQPFFSLVYRSRPGQGNVYGGEMTREFDPHLFSAMLNERATNARGVITGVTE